MTTEYALVWDKVANLPPEFIRTATVDLLLGFLAKIHIAAVVFCVQGKADEPHYSHAVNAYAGLENAEEHLSWHVFDVGWQRPRVWTFSFG